MASGYKKIAINPPEGKAVARYSVTSNEKDLNFVYIFRSFISSVISGLLIIIPIVLGGYIIEALFQVLKKALTDYSETVGAFIESWSLKGFFNLVTVLYIVLFIVSSVIKLVALKKQAKKDAYNGVLEEYGFFEGGYLYSNHKDLVRIEWDDISLAVETPKGILLWPKKVSILQFIPARYLCDEYKELHEVMRRQLAIKLITFARLGRERARQYENSARKVTVYIPTAEPIAQLKVKLDMRDLTDISKLWRRQIVGKQHSGLFICATLGLCLVANLLFFLVVRQTSLLIIELIMLVLLLLYAGYLVCRNTIKGHQLIINKPNYKDTVTYNFYEDEVLIVYSQGVSVVFYNDLHTIFEDSEGLALLFSKEKMLFIPSRYMKSSAGQALSHGLKKKYLSRPSRPRATVIPKKKPKKRKVSAFDLND